MSKNTEHMSDAELEDYLDTLEEETETNTEDTSANTESTESDDNAATTETETGIDESTGTGTETDTSTETEDTGLEEESQDGRKLSDTGTQETETSSESGTDTQEEIDYKAFYEKATADYKANGKVMKGVKSPEDLITALQMASNYALKTSALKPSLGRIKMLKDVTDEELNEMMDFRSRNPEVIKKALKEAEIDPIDLMDEEEIQYQPKDYRPNPMELEFDEAISSIEHTPEFERTSKVLSEEWDEASRLAVFNNPKIMIGLNEEIAMGRFDKIYPLVEQAKVLGKTNGLNDLELYQSILNNEIAKEQQNNVGQNIQPQKTEQEKAQLNEQRKKASVSTGRKTGKTQQEYDPATLSDEEFLELLNKGAKFI